MIQKAITALGVGVAMLAASPSLAASYIFNISGSYEATFTVSSTPSPNYRLNNVAFVLYDVSGVYGSVPSIADLTFYNTAQGGGLKIHDYADDIDLLTTHGSQLYTGTEASPTFKLGVFSLSPSAGLDRYTLTISDTAAAVPEPASWAMMIGGFAMVGGALRRRSISVVFAR